MSFSFDTDYVLQNNVALLQPLVYEDRQQLWPFVLHEPQIWRYSLVAIKDAADLDTYLHHALYERNNRNAYAFSVIDKRTGLFAGCTRLYDVQLTHGTCLLGYTWYGSQFWGSGLNKHCKYLLLQFVFETMQLQRVEIRADVHNLRSIAAIKRIGFQEEGILRSHLALPNGQRRSSAMFSMLQQEWHEWGKAALWQQLS